MKVSAIFCPVAAVIPNIFNLPLTEMGNAMLPFFRSNLYLLCCPTCREGRATDRGSVILDDVNEPAKAFMLFQQTNYDHGIWLLNEGMYQFTLRDGRQFSIFTSQYTPEHGGYAFSYGPGEDRFQIGKGGRRAMTNGVDIVMTHGPPLVPKGEYGLDVNGKGEHCGCPMLYEAVKTAKPRVHCFGHIHEGYRVQ